MTHLLPILLLYLGQEPAVVTERVAICETNHYHDENAKHIFSQRIYYEWNKYKCRFDIVAWRLIKPESPVLIQGKSITWHDKDTLRKVVADEMRETWTQYDPETEARHQLPVSERRELARPVRRNEAWQTQQPSRSFAPASP